MAKHPMQPIEYVDDIIRFKANTIVRYLLDYASEHGCSLNELHMMSKEGFTVDDWEQFTQLIGYSICGYNDLSFISNRSKDKAEKIVKRLWLKQSVK